MATGAQALRPSELVEQRLRGHTVDWQSRLLEIGLLLSLLISLGVLVVLLADIIITSFPVFATRAVDFLASPVSARPADAGMLQGILGSILLMIFVVILALPLGVGAAIYLEEYAHDTGLTSIIRTNIRNLAGVPAIVYGLLGLAVFVTLLGMGKILVAGGLTLAVVVLPIVVITAVRGAARRPDLHPGGRLRRGCHALGDHSQPRPAVRGAGHPDRHHPVPGPRLRRDGTAADGRRHCRNVQRHRPGARC